MSVPPLRLITAMTDYSQLPEWTCHKVVRAAQIEATGLGYPDLPEGTCRVMVTLETGERTTVDIDRKVFSRGFPVPGDYLVAYNVGTKDEYVSWSPAAVFEDGYSLGRRDASALGGLTPWQRQALADIGYPDDGRQPRVGDIVLINTGRADPWQAPMIVAEAMTFSDDGVERTVVSGLAIHRAFKNDGWVSNAQPGEGVGCWRWPERG